MSTIESCLGEKLSTILIRLNTRSEKPSAKVLHSKGKKMRYRKQKRKTIWNIPLLAILLVSVCLTSKLVGQTDCQKCAAWQTEVDPKVKINKRPKEANDSELSRQQVIDLMRNSVIDTTRKDAIGDLNETAIFEAIECLLKLKGRKHDSRIVGATRSDTSQTFGASSVEIASLYYVSYLYYQNWGHAGAAVLVNRDGKTDTEESVSKAYESYRIWFEKVRIIGLEEARKQRLDPLEGSGIRWY